MIEIKVNDEVRDVETDFFLGLSLRQLGICIAGLIMGCVVGFFLYLKLHLPLTLVTYLVVPIVLPFAAMAFYTWHEMSALTVFRLFFTRHFFDPEIKTYGSANKLLMDYQKTLRYRQKKERNSLWLKKR